MTLQVPHKCGTHRATYQSPDRQGKTWSKYRCQCLAPNKVFCVCADLKVKRVTWKSLEQRNLNHLFNPLSSDRIQIPANVSTWRQGLFDLNS